MRTHPAPVVTACQRLHLEIEQAVASFPKRHKWLLGQDLRAQALGHHTGSQDAWRARSRKAEQLAILDRLITLNDQLQAGLDIAHGLQCLTSFGRYADLARLAVEVGKQLGGWKRQVQQHLNGQSPAAPQSERRERPETLSTQAATHSLGAQG